MGCAPRALAAVLALAHLAPSVALADDAGEARAQFQRGVEAYGKQRYDTALEAFKASYRMRAVPVVLLNIAETYTALDAFDDAMTYLGLLEASAPADATDVAQREQVAQLRERIKRASGTLRITGAPEAATVIVDGRDLSIATLRPAFLGAGSHAISVSHPEFAPFQQRVSVASGAAATVDAKLQPRPHDATVRVIVKPEATVLVDGRAPPNARREGAAVVFTVPSGPHEISAQRAGMTSFEASLELRPGDVREMRATLLPGAKPAISPWLWVGIGVVAGSFLGFVVARSTQ